VLPAFVSLRCQHEIGYTQHIECYGYRAVFVVFRSIRCNCNFWRMQNNMLLHVCVVVILYVRGMGKDLKMIGSLIYMQKNMADGCYNTAWFSCSRQSYLPYLVKGRPILLNSVVSNNGTLSSQCQTQLLSQPLRLAREGEDRRRTHTTMPKSNPGYRGRARTVSQSSRVL
jgi:hypothetical protein